MVTARVPTVPTLIRLAAALLLGAALGGCEALGLGEETATETPALTDPAPAATEQPDDVQAAPAETPRPTSSAASAGDGSVVLSVWMPEALSPDNESAGGDELMAQLTAFDSEHPDIQVEVYTKLTSGPGSTLAYLRSARGVAPSILPDLTLLDLDALEQAANEELVVPVNTMLDPDDLADMYPAAVELGTVDGILIGMPYVLRMQHLVYREVLFLQPPNSFERVLQSPVPFVFPAGTLRSVNRTVLAQYMAATDGELVDEQGSPTLDEEALQRVLEFYAAAAENEILAPALLQLTDPAETWNLYQSRQAGLAVVASAAYLQARGTLTNTQVTWVPTESGEPYALVDGWLWAVTTEDPLRQEAALELLDFLFRPANQGALSEAMAWLPSQPEALAVWSQEDGYAAFADEVLASADALPESGLQALVGAAIQEALESVLLDGMAPAAAARQAAQRVNEPATAEP